MPFLQVNRFLLLWLHNPLDLNYQFFLGNLRLSSEIFGYLRKFSENVRRRLSGLQTTFEESSEIFGNVELNTQR